MDLTEMHEQLGLDLKMSIGTEVSTAEATRCIERAVDDLSRKIPRERIYEHTWIEEVTDDTFTTPATSDPDKFITSANGGLVDTEDGDVFTLTTSWQDIPRPVIITLTDANTSILRFTIIVKGTDADGVYREERFYRQGGLVQTGKVYFYQIYEVEVNEIYGSDTNDTLEVGSGAADTAGAEIWIQLDNPIKPESEKIYSAASLSGTLYVLDTDYYMDYANGRIAFTNAGDMAVGVTYYANYDKAQCTIDISDIIPDLIRIVRVIYPVDKIPEQSVAFGIWENMLTIGSPRTGVSQEAMTDGEHLAIYYEARHTPPTDVGSGSYPELLDQVVLIGAAAYALLIEALQYELQAVTDLTDADASVASALASAAQYLDDNTNVDAIGILAKITTDAAELRTAISAVASGALGKGYTLLDKVATVDLDATTPDSAVESLKKGEDKIDTLTDGADVPALHAEYTKAWATISAARSQAVMAYIQEAQTRLANLRTYLEEAGMYSRIAEGFLAQAAQYQEKVANDMLLADRFRAEALIRMAEFNRILDSKAEYRKRVTSVPVRQPA